MHRFPIVVFLFLDRLLPRQSVVWKTLVLKKAILLENKPALPDKIDAVALEF